MDSSEPIRVCHVIFHLGIGGLENGLVNLINGLEQNNYRHFIVCLNGFDQAYARRIKTSNVEITSLEKRDGHDPAVWIRMWRTLREVRPQIVHTRNFVALEMQLVALVAGVRGRVHGEHGWDVGDLDGSVRKYQIARRLIGLAVHRFIALSSDLEKYLLHSVGIRADKVVQIYNGVDSNRFRPRKRSESEVCVVGTVGRMKSVKNQTMLCRAFVHLVSKRADFGGSLRLRLVGSGPLESECRLILEKGGVLSQVEFCGDSDSVADEMRELDIFVLPSLAEGISNTVLEAMASGLPVIATRVGGNPELVENGVTGYLVESERDEELVAALEKYLDSPSLREQHGQAGRALAERQFSLKAMIRSYDEVYRSLAS